MAKNNLRLDLLEKSAAFKMFNKRYVDFSKEEMREYNKLIQRKRRERLNGFNNNGKE